MAEPINLPLEWAVFEATSGTSVYRVALVASEDDARRFARSMQRAAASGHRYYVEAVTP